MRPPRLKGLLLAAMLAGASLAILRPAYAAPESRVISMANSAEETGIQQEIMWDEDWFSGDSYRYNHELARLCGLISSTVYAQPKEGALTGLWEELGGEGASVRDYHYGDEEPEYKDKSGYTFALRKLPGEDAQLVLVAVRGTTGLQEWLSNLNIADSTRKKEHYHEGFDRSARLILKDLYAYLQAEGVNLAEARFLVTGHSRGAAVADLVGAYLDRDEPIEGNTFEASPGHIYVYTYATPGSSTVIGERRAGLYRNIFNIINPEDVVPEMPFRGGSWDYGTFGVNLYLPSAYSLRGDEERYNRLLGKVAEPYRKLSGREYQLVRRSEEAPRAVKNLQWAVGSVTRFYKRRGKLSHAAMVNGVRRMLQEGDNRTGLSGAMEQKIPEEGRAVLRMHAADTYNAWLQAGAPEDIYLRGTPTRVRVRLESQGENYSGIALLQGTFPAELRLSLPEGEEVAALKEGKAVLSPHGERAELMSLSSRTASFLVPEGEKLEVSVTLPEGAERSLLTISTELEANGENGLEKTQKPVSVLQKTLQPGESAAFLIDNRRAVERRPGH